jgi:hypothetical protein
MNTFLRAGLTFKQGLGWTVMVATCFACGIDSVEAQANPNDNRREYIRSSSPTKSGGRIISETTNGQTLIRIARSTATRPTTANGTNGTNAPTESNVNSALKNAANATDSNARQAAAGSAYPYPDARTTDQTTAYRQAANLPPSLNFGPNNRLAQCNCNQLPPPPGQLRLPPQQFQQAPFQAGFPQLGFQQQYAQGAPGYPLQPGLGVPQFNQTGGNWWSPFLTGSGYYTPLLNFRNMPQGTYLGQGIIGQPTAYVDSQPFRNLLRYISP